MATVRAETSESPAEPPIGAGSSSLGLTLRSRLRWIAIVTTACTMTSLVTVAGTVIGSHIAMPDVTGSTAFVLGVSVFLGFAAMVDLFIVNGHPSSEGDTLEYHGH